MNRIFAMYAAMAPRSMSFWFALLAAFSLMAPLQSVHANITPEGDVTPPETWTNSTDGYIGNTASGILTVDGGSNLLSCYGYIGYGNTATGVVNISGTGSTWANSSDLYAGYHGTGIVTQTSGTNSVAGALRLGYGSTSSGTYNLHGGVLAVSALNAGDGIATFNFGGGTILATGTLSTSLPMTLTGSGGNATVNTQSCPVTFSGALSGSGGLNKSGSGTLTLSGANTYAGATAIKAGTLRLGAAAQSAALTNGVNIQNDWATLVFEYDGETSPTESVLDALTAGYNNGWAAGTGTIYSTTCAFAGNNRTLGWTDDGTVVSVMQTLPGDATLDGKVDSADLLLVLSHYDDAGVWMEGDINYDGSVDFCDLNLVLANFGGVMPTLHVSGLDGQAVSALADAGFVVAVPEPGTLAMLVVGVFGVLACGRRRRK